jgi:hypothetical protein
VNCIKTPYHIKFTNSIFTNEINKAAKAAEKQPFTLNLGMKIAAICRQKPFIKKVNKPKVSKFIGNEINNNTGRTILFTRASTTAANIEYRKSSM